MNKYEVIYNALPCLWQDTTVTSWDFFEDFRIRWERLLADAFNSESEHFPLSSASVLPVSCTFCGIEIVFHINQLKMADWYKKELASGKKIVLLQNG